MSSHLTKALDESKRADRLAALRCLLRSPLVLANESPDAFASISRQKRWLADWFGDHAGWKLVVDSGAGFARLHKVPARTDATRAASVRRSSTFNRRRYVLLCLTLAALDDTAGQTTLATLVELVTQLGHDDDELSSFDPEIYSERRALVDALKLLVDLGVLAIRDGDAKRYVSSGSGDVLYDVNERLLGHLVSAPIPPALAEDIDHMMHETYADHEEGERLRSRHGVMRRLLDDPVVYHDELSEAERGWFRYSRGYVYRVLREEVGLFVERREEGVAAVDPDGELTDEKFPDGGSTVKHAALLLADQLTERARSTGRTTVTETEVELLTGDLIRDYAERCGWAKEYTEAENGSASLAEDAIMLLASFNLARRNQESWTLRSAIARFAPMTPERSAKSR